jgi:glycine/D-amino acid oxidase-like deaminating enzyme
MSALDTLDALVVGGGIMGASVALRLADGGMSVALVEQHALGAGASGVNAGTLSLQTKRAALMPYAVAGHALWRRAGERVGYRETGGLSLAFTPEEASYLCERVEERRRAGAPIELVDAKRARELEPELSGRIEAASYCAIDGYANASLTGVYYRELLAEAGVHVREGQRVVAIEPGFRVRAGDDELAGARLVLAGGAWLEQAGVLLGIALPITVRANIVSVTERMPPLLNGVVLHAYGRLTLKQKPNGTFLIGGAWQGEGHPSEGPGRVRTDSLIGNLRLAEYALPALAGSRLIRSWVGYEARAPDVMPLAGEIPGHPNAFVLGAVLGGYTIGPYIGRLLGDRILGKEPELPLFPLDRFDLTPTPTVGKLGTVPNFLCESTGSED